MYENNLLLRNTLELFTTYQKKTDGIKVNKTHYIPNKIMKVFFCEMHLQLVNYSE